MNVSYLGPKGTFSEIAVAHHFSKNIDKHPKSSIEDVFKSVEEFEVDYGVVPIENSVEGSVNNTLDLLLDCKVLINGEIEIIINQCLLSKEADLKSVNRIFGHSQSLAQCKKWIINNIPDAELIPVTSSSSGALSIKRPDDACIGSEIIAKYYSLNINKENIQDYSNNSTRFLVIGNSTSTVTGCDKTSLLIIPPNTDDSGSLYQLLQPFADNEINLSRIESRPSKMQKWSYVFFIDVDGHIENKHIQSTIDVLKNRGVDIKYLGSYPKNK
jgi:chorismate mutase/prephenate dehydratase